MITTNQMRKLEDLSEKHGVSKLVLMENAGRGVYEKINEKYDLENKSVLVVCGSGNNGGDGFVIARYLKKNKFNVKVLFLGDENKLRKESGYNYFRFREKYNDFFNTKNFKKLIDSADIIVDAMIGFGISGKLREPYSSVIDLINKDNSIKLCVDIPTGIDPDSGKINDKFVSPDLIYTFHDIKPGLQKFSDKVVVVDIGIPEEVVKEVKG
ncbi:NAD(P)H-hydrate epimerase [Candidatus Woesearchaeota archaeon]|nr:NAD(P)H-hydrate epimerase [Candidatus Woesearchaeota archaeon]